jgi:uncharacterized OB-fold protein
VSTPDAGSLILQECETCHRRWHTVYPGCPYCGSASISESAASGTGTIYSWVTIVVPLADPPHPVPYSVVMLDAGARVFGLFEDGVEPVAGSRVACSIDERGVTIASPAGE